MGMVLTGMGCDGTEGTKRVQDARSRLTTEHKSTTTVYGTLRSVVEVGCMDGAVSIQDVATKLAELVMQ